MGDLQRVRRTTLRSNSSEGSGKRFGVISFVLLLFAAGAGIVGWQYRSTLELKTTKVVGLSQASSDDIVRLAAVDTSYALYEISPEMVKDRVLRHPWVRDARVHRLPTGVLKISVSERMPILTAIGRSGRPSHYIDRECYMMPMSDEHNFDIPFVSGAIPEFHPVSKVDSKSLCQLAQVMGREGRRLDPMVSEFVIERDGNITLYTKPVNGRESLPVTLGKDKLGERIKVLEAFWEQILTDRSQRAIKKIDLRFDSQVVTE